MDLSCVSDFREVYRFLKGTDIVTSRVFLVVDNISSQESGSVVKALLRLGLTVGSKVLLVARSINVLRPLLQEDGPQKSSHYVYGTMSVPGLNKEEALQILLQSGDGVGLADSYAPEAVLTPRHKVILEEVVNMSGFSEEYGCMKYLPLVLKIMGEQFRLHELNLEQWCRTMKSLLRKVGLCKKAALKKMVLKSFETLHSLRLRDLFLDVALFIVPLSYLDGESHKLDEACSHLSLIHGCESEEIEFKMQQLQQRGFLTICKDFWGLPSVSVHDFYLECAASIEEACKYYWSSGLRWSKTRGNQANIEAVGTTQLELLRTVVLELDEGNEHFIVPSELSRVRAMVLRNCQSLKTLRGFANLRSLVSLEVRNCPSLKWVEPSATGHKQPYVQRLKWVNQDNKRPFVEVLQQHDLETSSSKKAILPRIGFKRPRMAMDGLLLQMKGLQVLTLGNTGITQYVDMSGCLPQLRVLEVSEHHMKGLRVCNLPNLECFVFWGNASARNPCDIACRSDTSYPQCDQQVCDSLEPRKVVSLGRDILAGCPKVQQVYMQCATFASSHSIQPVNSLRQCFPDSSLECRRISKYGLILWDCPELRCFTFGSRFRNLQQLQLTRCENLTEVSGISELPMLQSLSLCECPRLKIVRHLGDAVCLRSISVCECPNIQRCLLSDLVCLTELQEIDYDGPHNGNGTLDVSKWVRLSHLRVNCGGDNLIGFENLERLIWVTLKSRTPDIGHTDLVDLATLLGITAPCSFSFGLCLGSLESPSLRNLRSLNGIQFLGSLHTLWLDGLQNLSCLQGIECLAKLERLEMQECASVEAMPSLASLVQLRYLCVRDCKKLRSVEGCGELGQLFFVRFIGCESLARFPLDLRNGNSSVRVLHIEGSKFASGEAVVAWAEDEEVPKPLRHASLRALRWELSNTINLKTTSEMLVERVVQKPFNGCVYDEDNNDMFDMYEEEVDSDDSEDKIDMYEEDSDDEYEEEEIDMYEEEDSDDEYEEEIDDNGNCDEEKIPARVIRLAKKFDYGGFQDKDDNKYCTYCKVYRRVHTRRAALEKGRSYVARLPRQCCIDLCQSNAHFPPFLYYLFHHLCNLSKCPKHYRRSKYI